ncbi:MAG: hypothetical protein IKZ30_04045 [Oscillospiraceae bacterium]|nr:hypothetical protein [Oscillospiraceae bacterium]
MTDMEKAAQAVFAFAENVKAHCDGGEWNFRAFIEPKNTSSPEEGEVMPEGVYDGRRYTLIAQVNAFSGEEKDVSISAKSGVYELIRLEKMASGHWEGIMRRKVGVQ